jgi:hypothetical protein
MTVREYTDWISRQRRRGLADAEFAATMVACSVAGMVALVFVAGLIWGGM